MTDRRQALDGPPGFHLVTAVWGERFVDLFLKVALPNQLAGDNLCALADLPATRYRIFTRAEDELRIRDSAGFRQVAELMPADITVVSDLEGGRRRIASMTRCHTRAITDANVSGAALIFLSPDAVVSDGAFAALRQRADEGASAVMAVGLRLQLETFVPALVGQARAGGSMAPAPRELVALAMNHLHPISRSMFVESRTFNRTPAALCWSAADDAILVRSFHLHPLMVWPAHGDVVPGGSVDGDYIGRACPDIDRIHVVVDSDELVAFEFSGADKIKGLVGRQPLSTPWVAAWAARHATPHHRSFVRRRIRIHAGLEEARWRAVERRSDRLVRLVDILLAPGPWLARSVYAVSSAAPRWRKEFERSVAKPIRRRRKRMTKARARAFKLAARTTRTRTARLSSRLRG